MDFSYDTIGGFEIFGCSDYNLTHLRYYQYSIGSILFVKKKALKGVYEKIAIKEVRFPKDYVNLYVDTFNALWNENELVSYETAVDLINAYIQRRNSSIEELIKLCK